MSLVATWGREGGLWVALWRHFVTNYGTPLLNIETYVAFEGGREGGTELWSLPPTFWPLNGSLVLDETSLQTPQTPMKTPEKQ